MAQRQRLLAIPNNDVDEVGLFLADYLTVGSMLYVDEDFLDQDDSSEEEQDLALLINANLPPCP